VLRLRVSSCFLALQLLICLPECTALRLHHQYNYIGCFNKGGDGDLTYMDSGNTNEDCSNKCRNTGSKFFVRRQGGKCYCTDGEYAYSGHADNCSCDQASNIGGDEKQCAFRVMPTYLGCFKNTNRQDTFEKRMTHASGHGLSLAKCEEVCFDGGYRYVGRQWEGICYCGNLPNYDKYGATTGCKCENESVGSYKFCAYDLGPNARPAAITRSISVSVVLWNAAAAYAKSAVDNVIQCRNPLV
jgi:hypothetical protein